MANRYKDALDAICHAGCGDRIGVGVEPSRNGYRPDFSLNLVLPAQVDPHLDRFMADLQQRVAKTGSDSARSRARRAFSLTESVSAPLPTAKTLSLTLRPVGPHSALGDNLPKLAAQQPQSPARAAGCSVDTVMADCAAGAACDAARCAIGYPVTARPDSQITGQVHARFFRLGPAA